MKVSNSAQFNALLAELDERGMKAAYIYNLVMGCKGSMNELHKMRTSKESPSYILLHSFLWYIHKVDKDKWLPLHYELVLKENNGHVDLNGRLDLRTITTR